MEQAKCAGSLSNCQVVARCGKVIPLGVGSRAPVLLPGRLSPADQAGRDAPASVDRSVTRIPDSTLVFTTKPWGLCHVCGDTAGVMHGWGVPVLLSVWMAFRPAARLRSVLR